MSKQGTIIVVDDNKGVLSAVKLLLKNHFEHIVTLPSPITLPAALREENAQVVLLDMNFSSGLNTGNEGLYWLHEIKKIHQGSHIFFMYNSQILNLQHYAYLLS